MHYCSYTLYTVRMGECQGCRERQGSAGDGCSRPVRQDLWFRLNVLPIVLDITGWKIHGPGGAGEVLGINPNTLRHRMRKLGIPFRKQMR